VRIALALKGLDCYALPVNLLSGEQHLPAFCAINPQGRVPALKLESGDVIIQSPAIIEYLEECFPLPPLLAGDRVLRARQRAVAALIGCDIHPLHNVSVLDRLRALGHDESAVSEWIGHWISQGLAAVEQMIDGHVFCFGDKPSVADVYLLPQLYAARRFKVDLAACPRISRVEARALEHPAFRNAHPDAQPDKPD
jgi:maleylacetoacetate isomerase